MPAASPLTVEQHERRAQHHAQVAAALAATGEPDWAAVCYFYAAYHYVTGALVADPVFDDPTILSRINVELTPDDRYTERHKGRKVTGNGREWGVNELVLLLYRALSTPYERLHQASIKVRYGRGLTGDITEVQSAFNAIQTAYHAGELVYAPPP